MHLDLKVVQLLSSRLCHDLVGPAGAIQNGIELVKEVGCDEGEGALEIVGASSNQLLARLAFFRLAFGKGGLIGNKVPLAEARDLAEAFLEGSRISLDWSLEIFASVEKAITVSAIKILLNMILVATDGLPRGGILKVSLASEDKSQEEPAISMAVKASGPGACLSEDLQLALLSESLSPAELSLSAYNIHGFFCQRLAANELSKIEVSHDQDEVELSVLLPQRAE